ncbi:UvrB/UvrC motif-containing protein, partial [Streptosporangium sandarakinum]
KGGAPAPRSEDVEDVARPEVRHRGLLRSETSLIQTIGRAARNVSGQVHMYADRITPSMERAIEETNRRRAKQIAYNEAHGIDPQPLRKKIADILDSLNREDADTEQLLGGGGRQQTRGKAPVPGFASKAAGQHAKAIAGEMPRAQLEELVASLTEQMHQAAADLQFEVAARLRDEIKELKREVRDMREAGVS